MRVRSKLPALEGRRLTNELITHNNDFGGVTAVVYGSKGSGKTTLFLTLCQTVQCYNQNGNLELETSIWRGGDEDYWTWLPYERTRLFIHKSDIDIVSFKCDENLAEYDKSKLPQIIVYKNNKDLYTKLMRGGINVIYEPTTYTLTDRLKKMIQKRGVTGDELFKNKTVDPIIWWFEFIDWLRVNKSLEFISIFIDESDQLLPVSPSGARWHLNLWFKDIMRALRKRNLSLFLACHGYTDIDGRMRPKIMYRIYMKGSCSPSESLIWKTAPVTLPQGKYYIERDAWGWARFNKIDEQPRVLVSFKKEGSEDDEINYIENKLYETEESSERDELTSAIPQSDDIVLPTGAEDLQDKLLNRKPGEFISVEDPTIPEQFKAVDSDDEFTLQTPAAPSTENTKENQETSEIMRSDQNEYVSPTLDDLLEPAEDKYKNNIIKKDEPDKKEPLKDFFEED